MPDTGIRPLIKGPAPTTQEVELMKKTRIIARIIAGAAASAVLLTGALASPAQAAKDSGWGGVGVTSKDNPTSLRDSGWGGV
jgi:hypothetical protein